MRWLLAGTVAGLCWAGTAAATVPPADPSEVGVPTDPAPTTTVVPPPVVPGVLPVAQGPLVVLPAECVTPAAPVAVFEGTITDAVATTARFSVTRVLAGTLANDEVNGRVDVVYGPETRFLEIGGRYIVGAGRSAATGSLVSAVREPAPLFGGDAVVGANDTDVDCVTLDDPVRTLSANGTAVDTGVLTPLRGSGSDLLVAVLKPLAIAFSALVALVLVKQLVFAVGRSLREMGDAPPPISRKRRHSSDGSSESSAKPTV
jgi:hypothetical protein